MKSAVSHFYSLPRRELAEIFRQQGKEKFRSQQLFKWVYDKGITDFGEMSNLARDFRAQLQGQWDFTLPQVIRHQISQDGTQKFLFDLQVEAVLIPSRPVDAPTRRGSSSFSIGSLGREEETEKKPRLTLCVSSEVGCNLGCKFCLTGKQKMSRRLTAGEIVGQFMVTRQSQRSRGGEDITNIVFMGMGEPLDNPDQVFKAIEILTDDQGLRFPKRKITVSTAGIVPEMDRVIHSGVRLAVSLNGYDEESRSQLMPINRRYPLPDLLEACRRYVDATGDRVTFEYVLLSGITDQIEHARKLHKLVRSIPCKINIIAFNEHEGAPFLRPSEDQIALFHQELMDRGLQVLFRRSMGRDISAACGQLTRQVQAPLV